MAGTYPLLLLGKEQVTDLLRQFGGKDPDVESVSKAQKGAKNRRAVLRDEAKKLLPGNAPVDWKADFDSEAADETVLKKAAARICSQRGTGCAGIRPTHIATVVVLSQLTRPAGGKASNFEVAEGWKVVRELHRHYRDFLLKHGSLPGKYATMRVVTEFAAIADVDDWIRSETARAIASLCAPCSGRDGDTAAAVGGGAPMASLS